MPSPTASVTPSISVDYVILGEEHGFTEGAEESRGLYATVPYLVAWDDRYTFANEVMGGSKQSGGSSGAWTQTAPLRYSESPNLWARGMTIKPEGAIVPDMYGNSTKPIRYTNAIVTVNFGIPNYNYSTDVDPNFYNSLSPDPVENESLLWCTQELDFGVEVYTLPSSSVKYLSDNAHPAVHGSLKISVVTMALTFHRLPFMPFPLLRDYADSVCDAPPNVPRKFLGCDKGTVYLVGARTTREASLDGTIAQKLQITFKWRKRDWNQVMRDDGTWDTLINNDTSSPNLAYKDYSLLLPS
jgi:hypothetical protein